MSSCCPERAFRGALLRVCGQEMGDEAWKSFCFLHSIPERVREGGRSEVLTHLLREGVLSSERPEAFAELLRQELNHSDLASKFLGLSSSRCSSFHCRFLVCVCCSSVSVLTDIISVYLYLFTDSYL